MNRRTQTAKRLSGSTVLLWVFAFLLQTWSPTFIQFHFELNQEALALEFCINKDKPELHCEGQCHLKKQLEADNDNKQNEPGSASEFPTVILGQIDLRPTELSFTFDHLRHSTVHTVGEYASHAIAIFHPPQV